MENRPSPPDPGKAFLHSLAGGLGGCLGIALAIILVLAVLALLAHG